MIVAVSPRLDVIDAPPPRLDVIDAPPLRLDVIDAASPRLDVIDAAPPRRLHMINRPNSSNHDSVGLLIKNEGRHIPR